MDYSKILSLLLDCTNVVNDIRNNAELQLQQLQLQPKFGVVLAQVISDRTVETHLRLIAALTLRQYISKYWSGYTTEQQITVTTPEEDKQQLRQLPMLLSEPNIRINTAVGMAIAAIATFDFPEQWPELLQTLMSKIFSSTANKDEAFGAIRCLSLVSEHFSEAQFSVLPSIFENMFQLVKQSTSYPDSIRAHGLTVVKNCLSLLGMLYDEQQAACKTMLSQFLNQWLETLLLCCNQSQQSIPKAGTRALMIETLKVIAVIIRDLSQALPKNFATQLLPNLWRCVVINYPLFVTRFVAVESDDNDDDDDDVYAVTTDTDGGNITFETVITQLFEIVHMIVTKPKFQRTIGTFLPEIAYYAIGYAQMTAEQENNWKDEPNQFIADEDDDSLSFTIRSSATDLIKELCEEFGYEGVSAVVNGFQRRMAEAGQLYSARNTSWWKLRESSLLALGSVANDLLAYIEHAASQPQSSAVQIPVKKSGKQRKSKKASKSAAAEQQPAPLIHLNITELLSTIFANDLTSGAPDCLRGRALWFASRVVSTKVININAAASAGNSKPEIGDRAVDSSIAQLLLHASISGLADTQALPIRFMACRALARCLKINLDQRLQLQKQQKRNRKKQQQQQQQQQQVDSVLLSLEESHLSGMFIGLLSLMQQATSDTVHIVLDTLEMVIRINPEFAVRFTTTTSAPLAASGNASLVSVVVDLWLNNHSDPLLSEQITELFASLSKSQHGLAVLKQHVVPIISQTLRQSAASEDFLDKQFTLVESSLSLLTIIIKNSVQQVRETQQQQLAIEPQLLESVFMPLISLIMRVESSGMMQSGSECLTAIVYAAERQLASWTTAEGHNGLQLIIQVVGKLLAPDISDSAAMSVGPLISALVGKLGDVLGDQCVVDILRATVHRLAAAKLGSLIESLILIFAKLIHSNISAVFNFLHSVNVTHINVQQQQQQQENALSFVLRVWVQNQLTFFGMYQIKVTATALAKVLASGDARLLPIQVPYTVQQDDSGVSTRSKHKKAKAKPVTQEIMIPLPVMILVILARIFFQEEEAHNAGDIADQLADYDDEDDDDFDDDEDDDDFDDDELYGAGGQSSFKNLSDYIDISEYIGKTLLDDLEEQEFAENDLFALIASEDPLNDIDLGDAVLGAIQAIGRQNANLMNLAAQCLTASERDQLQKALNELQ